MPSSVSGEIRFLRGKEMTENINKEMNKHVRKTAGLCRDFLRQTMRDGRRIDDRRTNYETLSEESTIPIRRKRKIRRTSPLIETGNLMNSIRSKKSGDGYSVYIDDKPHPRTGTPASTYGFVHMEDHSTSKSSWIPNMPVPARPFFDLPLDFYNLDGYKDLEKILEDKIDKIITNAVVVKKI